MPFSRMKPRITPSSFAHITNKSAIGAFDIQVLAPFKALFGFDAINITLGLPYIRMSPDHGVAKDKIRLNISNPQSLNRCIEIISKMIK